LTAGRQLVDAVWEHEMVVLNGVPYVTAGDWADDGQIIALNPSYFAPYAYDIFRQVDQKHDWRCVIDSSYQVLFDASASPLGASGSAGLPPDWVGLDRASGELVPLRLDGNDTTRYGFDAARTYWRIALDQRWRGDGRAATYLRLAGFLQDEVQRDGVPRAVYRRDGTPLESTTSMVSTAGALAALQTLNPALANRLFAEQLVAGVTRTGTQVHWADPTDLYAQSWGWFATAF
jgi:endoglucanase